MLLYALPGFILIKSKRVGENGIKPVTVLLMYVCQPCLSISTFQKVSFSVELIKNTGMVFGFMLLMMSVVLFAMYLVFRKKYADVKYRIGTVAAAFGNVTFFGLPLLRSLFPDKPEMLVYSISAFIAMSVLGWTVASALITQDKKYVKPLKILLNPAVLGLAAALPFFFAGITFPEKLGSAITLVGDMSTPLCMIIIGMRLASSKLKDVFSGFGFTSVILLSKQIIMPLAALALMMFLPIGADVKSAIFIMCACPVAAVVLTFAELLGEGQKKAADLVILSTVSCIITLPLMSLLLRFTAAS